MQKAIYLAGPEVFLPDAQEIGRRKRALCSAYGFLGLYPGENGPPDHALTRPELSRVIFESNLALMRRADLLIANLSPFRGTGADPGTVWELGFMAGAGKPVFGYSSSCETLLTRIRTRDPGARYDAASRLWRDGAGLEIEDLDAGENLMLVEALATAGGSLVTPAAAAPDPDRDLTTFEQCLALAAKVLSQRS
jgi:nucleoside 2-deoxyribosyltransferase